MTKAKSKTYRILVGVNYGSPEVRHEPDEVVDDVPAKVVKPWLEQGVIEPTEKSED
jgi:hypothetical protein